MSFTDDGYDETGVFNALFEAIEDGAWLLDKEGVIMDVNASALKLLGYEETDLIGEQLHDFTPDPTSAETFNKAWSLNNEDDRTRFETFLVCADNTVVSVEMNCHFMGGGEAGQILTSCRALDHRKKVETAIEKRTDNYREILDKSPDGFLLMNPKGKIIETNDAYAKLVGYTKDELLQMNYYQLVIGKNGETKTSSLAENSLFNNYHKTKTGDIVPVQINIRQYKNQNGVDKILMSVHSLNNVLSLVNIIKKERKIMEKILAGLTNKDATGIFVIGSVAGISFANDYICEVFGYTKDELFYHDQLLTLMDKNDPNGNIETYLSVIHGDKSSAKFTHRFIRKNETIFEAQLELSRKSKSSGENVIVMLLTNIMDTGDTITENKDTGLAKIAALYKSDNQSSIIIATPSEGLVYANKKSYEVFGYDAREMVGLQGQQLVTIKSLPTIVKKLTKVYLGLGKKELVKCQFRTKEGTVFNADVMVTKNKESKKKYVIMQLNNIVHENAVETVS